MTANPRLDPGTRLGSYETVRILGEGGMGVVYEAMHVDLGKRVALKTLHPQLAAHPLARARFLREGRAAARIRHPHIVDVTDVGEHEGAPFLVMEYLEGVDLDAHLRGRGALPVAETLDLMLPVVAAVAAGHDAGVIHRDLKPHNVFLARGRYGDVVPKVLDFGVSKVSGPLDAAINLTTSSALVGTVAYMAPEQARGAKEADERSDQYALAVTVYECVAGGRAFAGDNPLEVLRQIGDGALEPLGRRAAVPPAFEAEVMRALDPDPALRHASVYAFGRALLPFAGPRAVAAWRGVFERQPTVAAEAAPAATTPGAQAPAPSRRARYLLLLLAGGLVAGLTLVALPRRRAPRSPVAAVAPPPPPPAPVAIPPPPPAPVRAVVEAPRRHPPRPAVRRAAAAPPADPPKPRIGANQAPILGD